MKKIASIVLMGMILGLGVGNVSARTIGSGAYKVGISEGFGELTEGFGEPTERFGEPTEDFKQPRERFGEPTLKYYY